MELNNTQQITSEDLVDKNKFSFSQIVQSSNGFCYFTTVNTAEKILSDGDENCIWVSPINRMNDLHESEMHPVNGDSVYGLCFCNSEMDNIPMWYLYGGINGRGARIKITAKKMQTFIENIDYVYAIKDGKKREKLYKERDFSVECGWIFYREDRHRIKYRDTYYSLLNSLDEFERNNFFVKDIEWKYEKEFRIVFYILKGETPPERIAVPIDKKMLMKSGGLSVMLAPERQERGTEKSLIEKYAKKFGLPESKVSFSKLKIKMNLIPRNTDAILEQFPNILAGVGKEKAFRVCEQLQALEYCEKAVSKKKTEKEPDEAVTV